MSETDETQRDEVRKLQARAHGMLPGVAGICMFMLVLTLIISWAATAALRKIPGATHVL